MIDFNFLYQGICGLANAHQAGTMAGHLGAAVAAGYFIGEDHDQLPIGVLRGIEAELQRIISGEEAIWFNAKQAGVTPTGLFKPFSEATANEDSIRTLVLALQKNIGKMRQSGHNVIFASIALRALHDHPEYATPEVVSGICKLTKGFNNAHPGKGYYGKQKGWIYGHNVKLDSDSDFPKHESIQQMVDTTIDELIASAHIRKQGFGGLWHIINHTAAITDLQRYGYKHVAKQALPAHHLHLRLWRSLPDLQHELGAVVKASHDPLLAVYWEGMLKRDEARLTHRIKTLYGYHTLRRFIKDRDTRQKADDAFLYLMA